MRDEQLAFYSTEERDYWATAWGSKPDEEAILRRYLDPARATVEAGTGNGRLLFALRERGFARLAGFDFVPELIASAREADAAGSIDFTVADARSLPYDDGAFEQAIYLSQIPSLFEHETDRARVVAEAFRILAPGGRALFSFLPYDVRRGDWRYKPVLAYLRAHRTLRGNRRSRQLLPRLRGSGRLRGWFLRDAGPHMYWYRTAEAEQELRHAGFELEALGTTPQVVGGDMARTADELDAMPRAGTLYAVCRKPG